MDKNAIKKYAVWARNELIARVSQKALLYGITKDNIVDAAADSINGKLLTDTEKKQRQSLIAQIKEKDFEQVMEEVAYTWFNRFSALRFMEVNGYLPSHVRVFTDEENNFKPQIITEAIHLEMDGLNMEKVYDFKEADKIEELYKYLLITQCNALNKILPRMFQRISDYTELLLPDNLLREGSVIEQMISMIPEEDWKDAVQIIGWLYQYYNSEPKDKVFENLKKNIKITKENIPAATQLFTPDWIVRYMVENSLGRLWLEGHPNDELKSNWKYYLDEAEQEADVKEQQDAIRKEYTNIKPEEIKCIDPCMGSGHILVYMFDVLVQIYEAYGYTTREAAASIVENNIWGLDIDERAAQLSYFAIMMKARQYDRRFFSRDIQPHVYAICESNHIDSLGLEYFINDNAKLKKAINTIIEELQDAKEYGSILNVTNVDFNALYVRFDEIKGDIGMYKGTALKDLLPLVHVAQAMAQKYDVVVTNPPYIGGRNMNSCLLGYIVNNYVEGKADLFSAFIIKCGTMLKQHGFRAMITQHSWMFLSSFEALRAHEMQNEIVNMAHLGPRAFEEIGGEVVQTVTWVSRNGNTPDYIGTYLRLVSFASQKEKELAFLRRNGLVLSKMKHFSKIPGNTFAYWLRNTDIFTKGKPMEQIANPRQGLKTLDNDYYIRFWHEISIENLCLSANNAEEAIASKCKWFPINHGGEYRQYYGNNYCVVNWFNDGAEMKSNAIKKYNSITRTITNIAYYFREGITWSVLCSEPSFRRYNNGFIFSNGGQCVVPDEDVDLDYLTGLLNSKITSYILNVLSPTLGFESGYVKKLPVLKDELLSTKASTLSRECIEIAKIDWDALEVSWHFVRHSFVPRLSCNYLLLKDVFSDWEKECDDRFALMKDNKQEINRYFIEIYGLTSDLSAEVEDKEITIRKADVTRDVKSFISYAVGCMFGRYSLDAEGLAYAGGEWDDSKYRTFHADRDNIIPICDDEYFEDDIVGRFIKFVETVYGKETLAENLKFIADALGGKGNPKDVIRNYFLNDFYNDHVKMYQKRPIYWQFDSGKKNGFKCLIYMHRYREDTIARIRTDYVHEQQSRYRTAIADLEQRINGASTSDRVKLNKQLTKLKDQDTEVRGYEEKIHHLADQMIRIDLDDGVKNNYEIFKDVLAKIK